MVLVVGVQIISLVALGMGSIAPPLEAKTSLPAQLIDQGKATPIDRIVEPEDHVLYFAVVTLTLVGMYFAAQQHHGVDPGYIIPDLDFTVFDH